MIATNLLQSLLGRAGQQPMGAGANPLQLTPQQRSPVPMTPAAPPAVNPDALRGIFDQVNQSQDSSGSLARLPQPDLTMPAAAPAPEKSHGIFGRIGDFIRSDEGKAILLRSGAKTITDGIGAGIAEGAKYAADQKASKQKQDNWLAELGVKQQQANSEADYRRGELHNATNKNAIEAQKASDDNIYQLGLLGFKGKELEDRHAQWLAANETTRKGQQLSYDSSMYGHRVSRANSIGDNDTSRANTGDMVGATLGKTAAGIGSNFAPLVKTTTVDPSTNQKVETSQRYEIPNEASIMILKQNPGTRSLFENRFGPGSASRYLSGQ